ncbi:MAG: hypothetical protein MHPSP_003213, partial [Paramarteilia canceri]
MNGTNGLEEMEKENQNLLPLLLRHSSKQKKHNNAQGKAPLNIYIWTGMQKRKKFTKVLLKPLPNIDLKQITSSLAKALATGCNVQSEERVIFIQGHKVDQTKLHLDSKLKSMHIEQFSFIFQKPE